MATNPTLGNIIRGVRSRKNWTLKQMSERTGIPLSTLAKVEHDRLTLSYDKLLQLSEKIGMGLTELLGEAGNTPAPAAVTARRSLGEIGRAVRVDTRNYDYYYLCTDLRRKRMIPIITHILAPSIEQFGELVRHSGEEYVYVIEGSIVVHTEFYNPVTLHPHQSIYIDSQMGHAYVRAEGCAEAKILSVCSSADEKFMEAPVIGSKPVAVRAGKRGKGQQ